MSEGPVGAAFNAVIVANQKCDSANVGGETEYSPAEADLTLRALRAQAEIQAIQHALARSGWNRKQAAKLLKISYRGLLYKIRQHCITR